jgi:hypothetical protein
MTPTEEGFTWTCTAGHETFATFSADALMELRRTVTDEKPVELYCLQCGDHYRMDDAMVANIRLWLDHVARRRRR